MGAKCAEYLLFEPLKLHIYWFAITDGQSTCERASVVFSLFGILFMELSKGETDQTPLDVKAANGKKFREGSSS